MMYQEPIDMITRMISVPLDTKSPPFQSASRPYGLSMTSFSGPLPAPAGGCGVAAAGAGAALASALACAVASAAAGCAGVDWARAAIGAQAMSTAANSARRGLVSFIMVTSKIRSVLEVEDDLVLADEPDRLGIELPLRQRANDLAVEDAVARADDLHVR